MMQIFGLLECFIDHTQFSENNNNKQNKILLYQKKIQVPKISLQTLRLRIKISYIVETKKKQYPNWRVSVDKNRRGE